MKEDNTFSKIKDSDFGQPIPETHKTYAPFKTSNDTISSVLKDAVAALGILKSTRGSILLQHTAALWQRALVSIFLMDFNLSWETCSYPKC